jgi:(p)ppGpp synthase/HD superfamily hydrolase
MIFEAIEFAAKAHSGQYRKATKIPYIVHPLNVAQILIEHGWGEAVAVAGVLHDTVEDTPVTLADIEQKFGADIAAWVQGASEPDKSDTWENRKQHTIDHLKTAPLEVVLIACADKLDNIRSMGQDYARLGESFWTRFNRPKAQQQWYYQNLVAVFLSRITDEQTAALFREFEREVGQVFG